MNNRRPIFERYMDRLAVEVTRRCNLNCDFCARGKAQPIDITKEIIDKTLDELSNTLIGNLRLSGGEPFLNPGAITYLFEQIIKRRIRICCVEVFTNGTVIAPELLDDFKQMLKYIREFETELPYLHTWFHKGHKANYNNIQGKKIAIAISDNHHGGADVSKAYDYYKALECEDIAVILQSDTFDEKNGTITLEGNARANCRKLFGDSISIDRVRMLDNEYNLIERIGGGDMRIVPLFASSEAIFKSISVSTNGNVFPGCMMGYDRVDTEKMFNIADCDKDFFHRVKEWCWEHPLCKKAVDIKAEMDAFLFCADKGITVYDRDDGYMMISKWANTISKYTYLPLFKQIHEYFPTFNFERVELLATARTVLCLYEQGVQETYIHAYLYRCSEISKDVVGTPELCHKIIDGLGILKSIVCEMTGSNMGLV